MAAKVTSTIRSNDASREHRFYPAFCHRASPTFFTWVKMGVKDAYRLKPRKGFEGQNVYFFNNHPIQFLCLAGIIVSRDEQPRRTILVLDDSTGATIEVVCDKPPPSPQQRQLQPLLPQAQLAEAQKSSQASISEQILAEEDARSVHVASTTRKPLNITPLVPGAVAKLRGKMTSFRGMLQLHLERYVILPDTNAEVQFWEERTRFLIDVLAVPWHLSEEEIETAKKESEEEETARVRKNIAKKKNLERLEKKRVEREEKDRLKIERRYAREEVLRQKYAAECAEASRNVGRRKR